MFLEMFTKDQVTDDLEIMSQERKIQQDKDLLAAELTRLKNRKGKKKTEKDLEEYELAIQKSIDAREKSAIDMSKNFTTEYEGR